MRTHEMTTGEGDAPVTCLYDFDIDGDLEELEVMLNGVDIVDALTIQQLDKIEAECRVAAEAEYEEIKDDARIENYIERMST